MDTELQQLSKTSRNPVQETRYQELLKQQPQVSSGATNDPNSIIQESIKRMQEANAPAIRSLQASIPETQAKYAQTRQQLQAQQPSLEQRYQNTLDSIKNQKTADVSAQTRITSNELGKRGLTGDSTLAQQEVQNAVQPINAQYTNLEQQTALSREDAIRSLQNQLANLTPQEVADTRSIQNAIAQLQSGAASQGVTQGLNLNAQNIAQQNADREFQAQQRIRDIQAAAQQQQNAIAQQQALQRQYMPVSEGQIIFDPTTGKIVARNPKTFAPSSGGAGGWE